MSDNSFKTRSFLRHKGKRYRFHSLPALTKAHKAVGRLPFSLKILLENLLRHEDGVAVKKDDIAALIGWRPKAEPDKEIFFMPARVILQDFTGVPAVADLAAMRNALKRLGGDPRRINPYTPADLVIDHSVQVDHYGSANSLHFNAELEMQRNRERYQFLKWGQRAFDNFHVVPPDSGIVHQVNLEFLAPLTMSAKRRGDTWLYPDTVIGTDSHTTMINGLGVLGWGVGGIEAEAALLGQPSSMLIPQVVGLRLSGRPREGVTATDVVLSVTELLRNQGVVGKFVEFFGPGLAHLSIADRATIANMAPEYGATCGIFPIDQKTVDYLRLTGRDKQADLTEVYYKAQGLWYDAKAKEARYSQLIKFDLGDVEPSLAGPSRPQDRVSLKGVRTSFRQMLVNQFERQGKALDKDQRDRWLAEGGSVMVAPELTEMPVEKNHVFDVCLPVRQPDGVSYNLCHGSVVIAAITSCTNTSNPAVLMAAGLLARNAVCRGLQVKPWVKTSLAPGSRVVTEYLRASGLLPYLEGLRFHVVGYGCTTCIGNSGPLPPYIAQAVREGDLAVASVLSGNRNFEGRVNAQVRANYLASPPLVVAYALAGNLNIDLTRDPLGYDPSGTPVYLRDIWPEQAEIDEMVEAYVTREQFQRNYKKVFEGDRTWNALKAPKGELYKWSGASTYIKEPPFFTGMRRETPPLTDIRGARVLAKLGDSVTTDHISPAGSIGRNTPAGEYLIAEGVAPEDFNSYGARRGNHEVMIRGTFANIRLRNQLAPGTEGGVTRHLPDGEQMSIYDAAMKYQDKATPLIVLAGKEYGTGSSRDWAAKGTLLLGIRAVIVESFERIHRSNLIGMGVLPLQFLPGQNADSLGLTGEETYDIEGLAALRPAQKLEVKASTSSGEVKTFTVLSRIDTANEVEYLRHGGILPYVLRQALKK